MLHTHLDLVGGIAGDMFLSAIIDARPKLSEGLLNTFRALNPPEGVTYSFEERHDGIFKGRGFVTDELIESSTHAHFPELCSRIQNCKLDETVTVRAIAIFTSLGIS